MRQRKGLADGAALNRVQVPGRHPGNCVEQIEALEDAVLDFERIARVRRLMQRGFNRERAHPVAGCGAAKTRVAFDEANAVAGLCEKRAGC